jgi:uncharacterized OB-fold protein
MTGVTARDVGRFRPEPWPEQITEDHLEFPHWDGLRSERLLLQRCAGCRAVQWGPEYICHRCHSFDLGYDEVSPTGTVYSWQRTWHAGTPADAEHLPYVTLVVQLTTAPRILLVGGLVGDQREPIAIGAALEGEFVHLDAYSLLLWRRA